MKLSDAILLGSAAVKPIPYGVLESLPDGAHGCAFGMALYAIGVRNEWELKNFGGDKLMPKEWAWCNKTADNPHLCSCSPSSDIRLGIGHYLGYITHLFNEHVMRGKMSLEQLVDYVRSVEPAEAPKYDGNLLPAMTAMVTGFVDKLTQERAKLFRETTRTLLPEFAYLLKQDGDPNHAPHNCINELSAEYVCGICGAHYEAKP